MPRRKVGLYSGETYHIFSHSVADQEIFNSEHNRSRFLQLIDFYRFEHNMLRFSVYLRLKTRRKQEYLKSLYDSKQKIDIHAFCLMTNHYHLLLTQVTDLGVSNFVRLIQNSYARYFNLKFDRKGSLFQSPFQAVRVESEEQLLHIARYIHLNPMTAYVLKDISELNNYPWTSYVDYLQADSRRFVSTSVVNSYLRTKKSFLDFHKEQVEYQRNLK